VARAKPGDVFHRWTAIWHIFFYVMIVASTALSFFAHEPVHTSGEKLRIGVLVVSIAGWYAIMMVRPGPGHRERPLQVGIYLAVAIVIGALLVSIDAVFLMVAMTLYNHIFAFMVMRRAIPFAGVLTAVIAGVTMRGSDPGATTVVLLGAGCALVFAIYIAATSEESIKRGALIEELERTREQLAFAERLAGRSEERQRIARELHDTVTQQLVGVVMHLEAAKSNEVKVAVIDQALGLAREGLAEARRLVWAERPAPLEKGTLSAAIAATIERAAREAEVTIEPVLGDDLDALPAAVQTLVLRAVQEALANVKKHARAERVVVSASVSDDLVTLDVQDDGIGFDPKATMPRPGGAGFGLRGLRERVAAEGGTLVVESAPGAGTTIAIHVPLAREARA
jgi:signal transduction histidine kinase